MEHCGIQKASHQLVHGCEGVPHGEADLADHSRRHLRGRGRGSGMNDLAPLLCHFISLFDRHMARLWTVPTSNPRRSAAVELLLLHLWLALCRPGAAVTHPCTQGTLRRTLCISPLPPQDPQPPPADVK